MICYSTVITQEEIVITQLTGLCIQSRNRELEKNRVIESRKRNETWFQQTRVSEPLMSKQFI